MNNIKDYYIRHGNMIRVSFALEPNKIVKLWLTRSLRSLTKKTTGHYMRLGNIGVVLLPPPPHPHFYKWRWALRRMRQTVGRRKEDLEGGREGERERNANIRECKHESNHNTLIKGNS